MWLNINRINQGNTQLLCNRHIKLHSQAHGYGVWIRWKSLRTIIISGGVHLHTDTGTATSITPCSDSCSVRIRMPQWKLKKMTSTNLWCAGDTKDCAYKCCYCWRAGATDGNCEGTAMSIVLDNNWGIHHLLFLAFFLSCISLYTFRILTSNASCSSIWWNRPQSAKLAKQEKNNNRIGAVLKTVYHVLKTVYHVKTIKLPHTIAVSVCLWT